ncbi:hypothetical protein NKR23_g3327 [Pleurostoma richardsiae]|uniref:Uncharacterized protein n=1 Tax=Pleurostoma richardsiae TaxID=41990 RepID=A0AA38S7E8_9PEZI|nr:hypothetical protein NKR23_g3327 [Pleurostoma richardsiae]
MDQSAMKPAAPVPHVIHHELLTIAKAIPDGYVTSNIEFLQADAYELPFADEMFDITRYHQPGGVVAAREGDYETECVWPEIPDLLKFHDLIAQFLQLPRGSPIAGRPLLPWAVRAGAKRGQIIETKEDASLEMMHGEIIIQK